MQKVRSKWYHELLFTIIIIIIIIIIIVIFFFLNGNFSPWYLSKTFRTNVANCCLCLISFTIMVSNAIHPLDLPIIGWLTVLCKRNYNELRRNLISASKLRPFVLGEKAAKFRCLYFSQRKSSAMTVKSLN